MFACIRSAAASWDTLIVHQCVTSPQLCLETALARGCFYTSLVMPSDRSSSNNSSPVIEPSLIIPCLTLGSPPLRDKLLRGTQVMDDRWAEPPAAGDSAAHSIEIQQWLWFSRWSCERQYDSQLRTKEMLEKRCKWHDKYRMCRRCKGAGMSNFRENIDIRHHVWYHRENVTQHWRQNIFYFYLRVITTRL